MTVSSDQKLKTNQKKLRDWSKIIKGSSRITYYLKNSYKCCFYDDTSMNRTALMYRTRAIITRGYYYFSIL